jgi:hypothetical protein
MAVMKHDEGSWGMGKRGVGQSIADGGAGVLGGWSDEVPALLRASKRASIAMERCGCSLSVRHLANLMAACLLQVLGAARWHVSACNVT